MGVAWMKKGEDAKALEAQAEAEKKARQESYGKLWRFWMEEKEEKDITFVDGALDPKTGALDQLRFYEHNLYLGGKWGNFFVCPEKTDPSSGMKCPICKGGDQPSLVAVFTIIDHSEYKGAKAVYKDTRKLFVATGKTYEMLNKYAQKLGGLVGQRFTVSRSTEKDPRVGNLYIPVSKEPAEVLKKRYVRTWKDKEQKEHTEESFTVADYEKEIVFKTPDELAQMVGSGPPAGTSNLPAQSGPAGDEFKNQL